MFIIFSQSPRIPVLGCSARVVIWCFVYHRKKNGRQRGSYVSYLIEEPECLIPNFSYGVAGACIFFLYLLRYTKVKQQSINVPLEGSSGIISYYHDAYEFIRNANVILKNAYKKYGYGTFKVPGLERDTIIINRRDLIEEIRKAPDDKISFSEAVAEQLASRWTFGENIMKNQYHAHVVRNQLTRALTSLFGDVTDEIARAFHDLVPVLDNEWVAVPALPTIRNIVCRASNRIFVGLPLCRNTEYIDLNISYTVDIMKIVYRLIKVPEILRPIVGPLITSSPRRIRQGMRLLRPELENRFRMYDEYGEDWSGKPNDMITWLIEEAPEGERRSVRELTKRMLTVNFAAIHTSSNSFAQALLHLAAEPEYIEPIREEVARVIKKEGWTKVAMTKMRKLDSFLKESQRINGINTLSLNRKVMSDFTLSDGTFLPAGAFIAANVAGIHHDDTYYPKADRFDGFRFSRIRDESSEECVKHQMVNTSTNYLAFGHGRHACPGRFFAVNELKVLMAHLILNYDVRAEHDGVRPENVYQGTRVSPNPTAKVLFKKISNRQE